jgi:hypothetical protein
MDCLVANQLISADEAKKHSLPSIWRPSLQSLVIGPGGNQMPHFTLVIFVLADNNTIRKEPIHDLVSWLQSKSRPPVL